MPRIRGVQEESPGKHLKQKTMFTNQIQDGDGPRAADILFGLIKIPYFLPFIQVQALKLNTINFLSLHMVSNPLLKELAT